jgi:C-terminal peptidase prc
VSKTHAQAKLIGLMALLAAACAGAALADGPQPKPAGAATAPVPAPAMPAELARHVQEITDTVLEHHIDPPARQQMVLSGIKALYRAAGVAVPLGLGGRVSAVSTPEQLAALLAEVWPKTTAKPVAVKALEDALLEDLVAAVPGDAELMTAKDARVAEQMAGNRYVGIHITLGMDDKEKRPMMPSIFPGGPAARAGIQAGAIIEEIDGADTKGMKLRDAVDRLRGDEGTDVTLKFRQPKETTSRTVKITRGQLPRATIVGFGASPSDEGRLRLGVPDPIGYLRITEITASTPHELRKLAQRMDGEGIRAVVLDLRGIRSSGSAVHPAVLLADSLLERGAIGRVRTARGETTYTADADALFRGRPIAVLVDQDTSGTAEWLAAALQDNHRAVIVGSPTAGAHRRRLVSPGVSPVEDAWPMANETIVKATVPVGDGRWSISMATGTLERGDGRPMADRAGDVPGDSSEQERPRGGVRPDHNIPVLRVTLPGRAKPPEKAEAYKAAEQDRMSMTFDPALNVAVTVLHQVLEKP